MTINITRQRVWINHQRVYLYTGLWQSMEKFSWVYSYSHLGYHWLLVDCSLFYKGLSITLRLGRKPI